MGADNDVDLSPLQAEENLLLFAAAAKARKRLHANRKVGESLPEGPPVLLHENRGGCQHRDLLPILDRLKGCADGDFGLSEAYISADEAIHGTRRLHVLFDFAGHSPLIGCVLIEEPRFHLCLPLGVNGEGKSL